jgi:predicted Zn-dependent peptidase
VPLRAFALILALAALLAPRSAFAELNRPVLVRRLASGLTVVICPDPSGADVSVLVSYGVGTRDEPGELYGLAHIAEHVMFTGSKHVAPGALVRLLSQAGATNVNAQTGMDRTIFHETLPPERLDLALWLESDRMGYLLDRLDEAALARERAAVLNEVRDKVTDEPLGALEVLTQALGGLSSPLREEVRDQSGASYRFGASFTKMRAASVVSVGGSFDPPKTISALTAILGAIRAVRTHGIGADILERARTSALATFRTRASTSEGVLDMAIRALVEGRSLDTVAAYPAGVQSVTAEDIKRVASRCFNEEALHVVVLGTARLSWGLQNLGLGALERRDEYGRRVGP